MIDLDNYELNQAIHELRGLCWHEEPDDWEDELNELDYPELWQPTCPKCGEKFSYEVRGRWGDRIEPILPDYCNDRDICAEVITEFYNDDEDQVIFMEQFEYIASPRDFLDAMIMKPRYWAEAIYATFKEIKKRKQND